MTQVRAFPAGGDDNSEFSVSIQNLARGSRNPNRG